MKNLGSVSFRCLSSAVLLLVSLNHVVFAATSQSKYIVIQNIATEKTRVYERCTSSPGCAHRMILETNMVVGSMEGSKDNPTDQITRVGHYQLQKWNKFYQDGAGAYPSWYDPNLPELPSPGSPFKAWGNKDLLPAGGNASMRGAFGWYTAQLTPNSDSQHIHGTFGWGPDQDKYIQRTRSMFVNLFKSNPRSHGCTRVDNRVSALLQYLLKPGTEVFRIYAKEALKDPTLSDYQNQIEAKPWDYILTKQGVRASANDDQYSSDKKLVLEKNLSASDYLEEGTYLVDQYPDAVPYKKNAGKLSRLGGKAGNVYGIADGEFHGVFLVDQGLFIDYANPESMPKGGMPEMIPAAFQASGDYVLPGKISQNSRSSSSEDSSFED